MQFFFFPVQGLKPIGGLNGFLYKIGFATQKSARKSKQPSRFTGLSDVQWKKANARHCKSLLLRPAFLQMFVLSLAL
jgi:hypothetical protein